jgi:hypothetical protein
MNATLKTLDTFLDPLTGCMTREVAQQIVSWKPDPDLQDRIQELGQKADNGTLTPDELAEYEDYIEEGDVIALIQAKARRFLSEVET